MMAENSKSQGVGRDMILTECVRSGSVDYLPGCCDEIPQSGSLKREKGQAINSQDPLPMTHYFH